MEALEPRVAPGEMTIASFGMFVLPGALGPTGVTAAPPIDESDSERDFSTDLQTQTIETGPPDYHNEWPRLEGAARNPGSVVQFQQQLIPPPNQDDGASALLEIFADEGLQSALLTPPPMTGEPPRLEPIDLPELIQPREPSGGGGVVGLDPAAGGGAASGGMGGGFSQGSASGQPAGGDRTVQNSMMMTNTPPYAEGDRYSTLHDTQIVTDATSYDRSVLKNDHDSDFDPLTATVTSQPQHGTLEDFQSDGYFTYVPDPGFVGNDTFTYSASDGIASDTATVTIEVYNGPPYAEDDGYSTLHDTQLVIVAAPLGEGVLKNDLDSDFDSLTATVASQPQHGTLEDFQSDGSFTYTPDPGYVGTDTFTYTASDGIASDTATVTINVYNVPPQGVSDEYGVLADAPVTIGATEGVLVNDIDPDMADNSSLTAVLTDNGDDPNIVGDEGTVSLASDGSFTYTPSDPDWYGTDYFKYKAFDGEDCSNEVTVAVNVHDLRITFNGTDITVSPGETVAGMKNIASANLVGPGFSPGAPTYSNWDWSGSQIWAMVEAYTVSVNVGYADYLGGPGDESELQQSFLESYFIYGGDRFYNVSVDVLIGNTTYSLEATGDVNVLEPTLELAPWQQGMPQFASPFYGELTTMDPKVGIRDYGILPGGRGLGLGDLGNAPGNDPGIEIYGSVKVPAGYPGQIGFIQLVSSTENWYSVVGGNDSDSTGGFVLDVGPGGAFYGGMRNAPGGVASGAPPLTDSPISPISPSQMTVFTRDDSFKTYLMYKPDGPDSIYVTVGLLTWSWGGTVTREYVGNDWVLSDSHAAASPGQASNVLPLWLSNYGQEMNE